MLYLRGQPPRTRTECEACALYSPFRRGIHAHTPAHRCPHTRTPMHRCRAFARRYHTAAGAHWSGRRAVGPTRANGEQPVERNPGVHLRKQPLQPLSHGNPPNATQRHIAAQPEYVVCSMLYDRRTLQVFPSAESATSTSTNGTFAQRRTSSAAPIGTASTLATDTNASAMWCHSLYTGGLAGRRSMPVCVTLIFDGATQSAGRQQERVRNGCMGARSKRTSLSGLQIVKTRAVSFEAGFHCVPSASSRHV